MIEFLSAHPEKGVFGTEGGRRVIRDGNWDDRFCHGTWTATKQ
jgi:hypothetical protein